MCVCVCKDREGEKERMIQQGQEMLTFRETR